MNKKLLLVSLLSVGMLVGCGGGDKPADTTTPSEDNTPSTSEEVKDETLKTYGHEGYYLIGTGNGWSDKFWTFDNADIFYLKPVGDGTFTLTGSVTEEDLKNAEGGAIKWEYKVRHFDGEGKVEGWYPDGVENNNSITEAGEYTFTFNPKGLGIEADKTDGSGKFQLLTKHEKVGDAKAENRLKISSTKRSDLAAVNGEAVIKAHITDLETGLKEGEALYTVIGDKVAKFEGAAGEATLKATFDNVMIGEGPLNVEYDLPIYLTSKEIKSVEDLDPSMKFGQTIHAVFNAKKHNQSVEMSIKEAKPQSVAQVIDGLKALKEAGKDETLYSFTVKGIAKDVKHNEDFDSYDITLDAGDKLNFMIYSGKLAKDVEAPKKGATVEGVGRGKIFEKDGKVTYQIAFDTSHKQSPSIYSVDNKMILFVKGTMNNWSDNKDFQLTEVNKTTHEFTIALKAGDEFKIATSSWDPQIDGGKVTLAEGTPAENFELKSGSNIKCLVEGTYKFTVTIAEDGTASAVFALVTEEAK